MIYCNAVGSQTEVVFDGGSLVFNASGRIVNELKYFEEDFQVIEVTDDFYAHQQQKVHPAYLTKYWHPTAARIRCLW